MREDKGEKPSPWELLNETLTVPTLKDPPWVSFIIPTHDCAQTISVTLDGLTQQIYPKIEIIIVDSGSQDKTIPTIRSYDEEFIRIFTVAEHNIYEMWNKGASRAKGKYLNFIYPGDFLIWPHAISYVMSIAEEQHEPPLIYSGSLLRDGINEPRILFRALNAKNLAKGLQPTTLTACWFRKDAFHKAGRFNPSFTIRGGLDLLCRLLLWEDMKVVPTTRVLTDYHTRRIDHKSIWLHFYDTLKIIYTYFGLNTTVRWLLHQKDLERSIKLWLRRARLAMLGR